MAKITYRKIEERDLSDRVRWFSQKEISQFLNSQFRQGTTLEKQKEWFSRFIKRDDAEMFVIECDGKPVGNVALTDISKEDSNAGLFIVVGEKDLQRKGVGTDAINFITNYGFDHFSLHKIWLYVCAENTPAIKLYEKCGFVKEGILKDMWKIDGKYYDEIVMAKFNPKN